MLLSKYSPHRQSSCAQSQLCQIQNFTDIYFYNYNKSLPFCAVCLGYVYMISGKFKSTDPSRTVMTEEEQRELEEIEALLYELDGDRETIVYVDDEKTRTKVVLIIQRVKRRTIQGNVLAVFGHDVHFYDTGGLHSPYPHYCGWKNLCDLQTGAKNFFEELARCYGKNKHYQRWIKTVDVAWECELRAIIRRLHLSLPEAAAGGSSGDPLRRAMLEARKEDPKKMDELVGDIHDLLFG
eukprot:SAG22_NODE_67_length_22882_cov_25.671553_7_plen_238_part_00